jgi:hypothetical protein
MAAAIVWATCEGLGIVHLEVVEGDLRCGLIRGFRQEPDVTAPVSRVGHLADDSPVEKKPEARSQSSESNVVGLSLAQKGR